MKNKETVVTTSWMLNSITIPSIEEEDKSSPLPEESCTPPKWNLKLDSLNPSSWPKLPAQVPTWVDVTNAWTKEEEKLSKKSKYKVPHYSWSKPIFPLLNHLVSQVILDKRLEEKLSHNVHLTIGKNSVVIHLTKKIKPWKLFSKLEKEKVLKLLCPISLNFTINCDQIDV